MAFVGQECHWRLQSYVWHFGLHDLHGLGINVLLGAGAQLVQGHATDQLLHWSK